jgi:hypothetical protein
MVVGILILACIIILLMYLNLKFIKHPKMKRKITEHETIFSNKYVDDE